MMAIGARGMQKKCGRCGWWRRPKGLGCVGVPPGSRWRRDCGPFWVDSAIKARPRQHSDPRLLKPLSGPESRDIGQAIQWWSHKTIARETGERHKKHGMGFSPGVFIKRHIGFTTRHWIDALAQKKTTPHRSAISKGQTIFYAATS